MIEALILSIVQGVTEFLPISSSSHLLLASEYLNLSIKSLSQDISLHIGSFIAVLIYFKEEMDLLKNQSHTPHLLVKQYRNRVFCSRDGI